MTRESLMKFSLSRLVDLFEATTSMVDPMIATVRGWLMDAIEEKNPEGFNAWLDSELASDEALRGFVL